jgi:hypothetical protein
VGGFADKHRRLLPLSNVIGPTQFLTEFIEGILSNEMEEKAK